MPKIKTYCFTKLSGILKKPETISLDRYCTILLTTLGRLLNNITKELTLTGYHWVVPIAILKFRMN